MKFILTINEDNYFGTFDFDTLDAFIIWANDHGHPYTYHRIADRLNKEGGSIYLGHGATLEKKAV